VFAPPPPAQPVALTAGVIPWVSRVPTTQRVAFITIDDGLVRLPQARQLIIDSGVPVTLFPISSVAAEDPGYFRSITRQADAVVEDHTVTHPDLKKMTFAQQKKQICGGADQLQHLFGARPTLFRAPFGERNASTLEAVAACDLKAAFFWHEAVNDGRVQFQAGTVLHPGDVILMHFRTTFVEDFLALLKAIHDARLTPARLVDYYR